MIDKKSEYKGLSSGAVGKSSLRVKRRLFYMAMASLLFVPWQSLIILSRLPLWWPVPYVWHRSIARIFGLHILELGQREKKGPILFVANHISWLDIILLGGRLPKASFVAKDEIAGWGIAAFMAKMQRTIFIARSKRSDSANQRDTLLEHINKGSSLIMFPEATSTSGINIEPFKSSLFSVAEQIRKKSGRNLKIQPITISYPEMNGMPLNRAVKDRVAWLGKVELTDHVTSFLNHARTTAVIEYHPVITVDDVGNRKKLAAYCENVVRQGLMQHHRLSFRQDFAKERIK